MRYLIIFITLVILYIIFRRPSKTQDIKIYRNDDKIDLTTTRFRRGIPKENIKFRPEDEIGVIQLFHVYDT